MCCRAIPGPSPGGGALNSDIGLQQPLRPLVLCHSPGGLRCNLGHAEGDTSLVCEPEDCDLREVGVLDHVQVGGWRRPVGKLGSRAFERRHGLNGESAGPIAVAQSEFRLSPTLLCAASRSSALVDFFAILPLSRRSQSAFSRVSKFAAISCASPFWGSGIGSQRTFFLVHILSRTTGCPLPTCPSYSQLGTFEGTRLSRRRP